jgi:hypothetical protein
MILVSSGYDGASGPAAAVAAWLLLAILLWLNNGLRYIWGRTEFNMAAPADQGRAATTEGQDTRCPRRKQK